MTRTHSLKRTAEYFRQSKLGLQVLVECHGSEGRSRRTRASLAWRAHLPIEPGSTGGPSALLLAADVHLITLRDPFVGYVLPSKIHACIESGKRILFVGSQTSDVHLLASRALPSDKYCRVDVGDVDGLVNALHAMERAVASANAVRRRAERSGAPSVSNRSFGTASCNRARQEPIGSAMSIVPTDLV